MERTVWRRIVHPLSIQQTKHIKYIQRKMLQIIPYFLHVVVNISISAYLFIFLNILTFVYFITPNPHSVQYYYVHVCSVTRCQVWECGKMWCLSNIIFSIFLIDLVYIFMGRVQQHWLFMFHTVDRCRKPATASTYQYQYLLLYKGRKQENLIQQK